jgi:Copper amine oxidase N-terminal domain.
MNVTPVSLNINGLAAKTTDVKGKETQTFYSDGTTYASVRGLAEALGQDVSWNSKTNSVEIGTEGSDAANDAAYLKEYFSIAPMDTVGVVLAVLK